MVLKITTILHVHLPGPSQIGGYKNPCIVSWVFAGMFGSEALLVTIQDDVVDKVVHYAAVNYMFLKFAGN